MKTITLTQGKVALVSDEDYLLVSQHKWHAARNYAHTSVRIANGKQTTLQMHRLILGVTDANVLVDHADGDGLNNQRYNIRPATATQNQANKRKFGVTSKYRGVSWHKMSRKFEAQIQVKGKNKHLGCFSSEVDAARRYDGAAVEHFGEFARLNFPMKEAA
jgi:AP2 domain